MHARYLWCICDTHIYLFSCLKITILENFAVRADISTKSSEEAVTHASTQNGKKKGIHKYFEFSKIKLILLDTRVGGALAVSDDSAVPSGSSKPSQTHSSSFERTLNLEANGIFLETFHFCYILFNVLHFCML